MIIGETPKLLDECLLFREGNDEEVFPWNVGPEDALRFAESSASDLLER